MGTRLCDWVDRLKDTNPELHGRLNFIDFLRLAPLCADIYNRAHEGLRLDSTSDKVIPLLQASLRLAIPQEDYEVLWGFLYPYLAHAFIDTTKTIKSQGLQPALPTPFPEFFLSPPVAVCVVCDPSDTVVLHHHKNLYGYMYDIDGVHAIQVTTKRCRKCDTMYRPSSYRSDPFNIFYSSEQGKSPVFFQVHRHYFMTHTLARHLRSLQMLAHVSIFNLVNTFNFTHIDGQNTPKFDISFSPRFSEEVCQDGLDIHSLLIHAERRGEQLRIESSGGDELRLRAAMTHHLEMTAKERSPHADHFCSACVRVIPLKELDHQGHIQFKSIKACVCDGTTVGHWCCSASKAQLREIEGNRTASTHCENMLERVNDRYCPLHYELLQEYCLVQPCVKKRIPGQKTCDEPTHVTKMKEFSKRKTQNFVLSSKLGRPGSKIPADPTPHLTSQTGHFLDLEEVNEGDEAERAHEAVRDGGGTQKTPKLCVSRRRTHNEQLIVLCCGIILDRQTFYFSEGPKQVQTFLESSFERNGWPDFVFYDNACNLVSTIYKGKGDSSLWWNTIVPVDAFHMRSHSQNDEYCQNVTNPRLFPDLQEGGNWVFNSSAAELTNVWFTRFSSVCRNMHSVQYNFFLNEMITLRNEWLINSINNRSTIRYIGKANYSRVV